MTRAVLENFGGELPAMPVDALPPAAAQEAVNLFAGSTDFRPLHEDVTVAACPTGTRTIYRTQRRSGGGFHGVDDEASGWMVHSTERSYVRGQVDDDATERTYFTDNTVGPYPQAFDLSSAGTPRRLGVPAPDKLVVSILPGRKPFTRAEADTALDWVAARVRSALIESTVDPRTGATAQLASRYTDFYPANDVPGASRLTPRNGPASSYSLAPTEEIAMYLPEQYRAHSSALWAIRPLAELQALFGAAAVPQLGVVVGGVVGVPLVCLPPSWIPDKKDPANPGRWLLETRLSEIPNQNTGEMIFKDGRAHGVADTLVAASKMSQVMTEAVAELDATLREFKKLVLDTPVAGAGAPRPVEPTKPTVPQYLYNTSDPGG